MVRLVFVLVLVCGFVHAAGPAESRGQDAGAVIGCGEAVARGAGLVQEGTAGVARQLLAVAVARDPGCYTEDQGAAAYWLGRTHLAEADTAAARAAWHGGLAALDAAGRFDGRLAEAYLRVYPWEQEGAERRAAALLYERFLGRIGSLVPGWEADVLDREVARLHGQLPASVRAALGLPEVLEDDTPLAPDAGGVDALVRWWRSQDPLPATVENERLVEYHARVSYAMLHFASPERRAGYDDRGEVYVRYGEPYRRRAIRFNDTEFFKEVVRFGVQVSLGAFPENEIWTYQHVDRAGTYLFVEGQGGYRLGEAGDLIPPELRRVYDNSDRSQNRAYSSINALYYLYEKLSLLYSDAYGPIYDALDQYMVTQDHMQSMAERQRASGQEGEISERTVGEGIDARTVYSLPFQGLVMPGTIAQKAIRENDDADRYVEKLRGERMPRHYTAAMPDVADLPVAMRTARFLDPDGTTRTEIYWGAPTQALQLSREELRRFEFDAPPERYLINFWAVQQTAAYHKRVVHQQRYMVPGGSAPTAGILAPQVYTVQGDTGLYHLGVQWDQHVLRQERPGADLYPGRLLKARVGRADSLRALDARPAVLEMSDLRPLRATAEAMDGTADPLETAQLYPYREVTPGVPLVLYFEVYHLGFGEDDQTHYTVSYEVARRTPQGLWERLTGGREGAHRTAARTAYTSRSRTAREYIMLALGDWSAAEEREMYVTVRVTDETTGQQVARSLVFDLVPEGLVNR